MRSTTAALITIGLGLASAGVSELAYAMLVLPFRQQRQREPVRSAPEQIVLDLRDVPQPRRPVRSTGYTPVTAGSSRRTASRSSLLDV